MLHPHPQHHNVTLEVRNVCKIKSIRGCLHQGWRWKNNQNRKVRRDLGRCGAARIDKDVKNEMRTNMIQQFFSELTLNDFDFLRHYPKLFLSEQKQQAHAIRKASSSATRVPKSWARRPNKGFMNLRLCMLTFDCWLKT